MKIYPSILRDSDCAPVTDNLGLYSIETRLDYNVYTFDSDFIHLVRYAFSTDCTSEMNESQLEFFLEFIDWVDAGRVVSDGAEPYLELDAYLVRLTECTPNPVSIVCGDSINHTYTSCP